MLRQQLLHRSRVRLVEQVDINALRVAVRVARVTLCDHRRRRRRAVRRNQPVVDTAFDGAAIATIADEIEKISNRRLRLRRRLMTNERNG